MPQDLEAKEEPYLKFSQVLEIFHLLWAIRKAFFQSMKLLSYVPDMRLWPVSIFKHFQVHGNNLTQDDPFFISLLKNTIKKKGLWVPVSRERKEDKTQHTGILCHSKQDDKGDVAAHVPGLAVPLGQFMVQYKAFYGDFCLISKLPKRTLLTLVLPQLTGSGSCFVPKKPLRCFIISGFDSPLSSLTASL